MPIQSSTSESETPDADPNFETQASNKADSDTQDTQTSTTAEPRPTFDTLPPEIRDEIYAAHLLSLPPTPASRLEIANLLLALSPRYKTDVTRMLHSTKTHDFRVSITNFDFNGLITLFRHQHPQIHFPDFQHPPNTHPRRPARLLYIDLLFSDDPHPDVVIRLFYWYTACRRLGLSVHYTIHPPDRVGGDFVEALEEDVGIVAGFDRYGLWGCLINKFGRISRGSAMGSRARRSGGVFA
ncbi:hypothetical protein MBLNU230_g5551t1 [Neophaeotheca triangularis]